MRDHDDAYNMIILIIRKKKLNKLGRRFLFSFSVGYRTVFTRILCTFIILMRYSVNKTVIQG